MIFRASSENNSLHIDWICMLRQIFSSCMYFINSVRIFSKFYSSTYFFKLEFKNKWLDIKISETYFLETYLKHTFKTQLLNALSETLHEKKDLNCIRSKYKNQCTMSLDLQLTKQPGIDLRTTNLFWVFLFNQNKFKKKKIKRFLFPYMCE